MKLRPMAGTDRAPQLVVLGAPRSGTTSLATYLGNAGLAVGVKDSFYLMDSDAGLRGATNLSTHGVPGYLALFNRRRQPTVEVTAGYIFQRTALEFFRTWEKPPQFALIVRDPVKRLRSIHRYFTGNLGILPREMTFTKYVDALERGTVAAPDKTVSDALRQGRYVDHLRPWVDAFGRDAIEVISFDDLATRPADVVARLGEHVGVNPTIDLRSYEFATHNQSYLPGSSLIGPLTAVGRRVVPAGRLRSWGGEALRRWQATRPDKPATEGQLPLEEQTLDRLSAYYADVNEELARQFGISTATWT